MARPTLKNHRKFRRLRAMLGLSTAAAYGLLGMIWDSAYESGDEHLGDGTDVALACEWDGDVDALVGALMTCGGDGHAGFIEKNSIGYVIHDLWDHAPDYVRTRRIKEEARRVDRVCENCGIVYHSSDPKSRFCGTPCRQDAWRKSRRSGDGSATEHDADATQTDVDSPSNDGTPAPAPAPAPAHEESLPSLDSHGPEERGNVLHRSACAAVTPEGSSSVNDHGPAGWALDPSMVYERAVNCRPGPEGMLDAAWALALHLAAKAGPNGNPSTHHTPIAMWLSLYWDSGAYRRFVVGAFLGEAKKLPLTRCMAPVFKTLLAERGPGKSWLTDERRVRDRMAAKVQRMKDDARRRERQAELEADAERDRSDPGWRARSAGELRAVLGPLLEKWDRGKALLSDRTPGGQKADGRSQQPGPCTTKAEKGRDEREGNKPKEPK